MLIAYFCCGELILFAGHLLRYIHAFSAPKYVTQIILQLYWADVSYSFFVWDHTSWTRLVCSTHSVMITCDFGNHNYWWFLHRFIYPTSLTSVGPIYSLVFKNFPILLCTGIAYPRLILSTSDILDQLTIV